MKRFLYSFIFIIAVFAKSNAQVLDTKWIKVVDSDEQSVFLDSTNIKHINNQITIVSLTQFTRPQYISAYKKEAGSIKSQILFNISTRKYSLLGSLYYDSQLRIIGETSIPGLSLGNETFAIPVDSNKIIKALYRKTVSLLEIDTTKYFDKESANKEERLRSIIVNSDSVQLGQLNEEVEKNSISIKANNRDIKINTDVKLPKNDSEYNYRQERNVRSTIFTDGQKYCFQVSSWKQKTQAEREVERLRRNGEKAFFVEANVPSKGGKWYRVRIGYFNSIEEIENYIRKR